MKKLKVLILLSYMIVLSQPSAFAQHQIDQSVFGNGGTTTSNENFSLSGTLGQPLVGSAENNAFISGSGFWQQTVEIVTSVEQVQEETLPEEYHLEQNYPNPFNPTTTISFEIPQKSDVTLKIYDLIGREVATLVDKEFNAGKYDVRFEGTALPTGVYFYRLEADEFVKTRKLTLLK